MARGCLLSVLIALFGACMTKFTLCPLCSTLENAVCSEHCINKVQQDKQSPTEQSLSPGQL